MFSSGPGSLLCDMLLVGDSSSYDSLMAEGELRVSLVVVDERYLPRKPGVIGLAVTSPLPDWLIAFRTQSGVWGKLARNFSVSILRFSSSRAARIFCVEVKIGCQNKRKMSKKGKEGWLTLISTRSRPRSMAAFVNCFLSLSSCFFCSISCARTCSISSVTDSSLK